MARDLGSKHAATQLRVTLSGAGAACVLATLAGVLACATGVDVSDAELAEICATPGSVCGDAPAGSGGSNGNGQVGSSGSPGVGTSGSSGSGGVVNPNTGTGGAMGSAGSGNSGSAGSGGSGPALQPLARGTCMAEDDVVIVYTDRGMGSVATQQATMVLHVQNDGPAFTLTDLTIRYWFTDDGLSDFIADIDYASLGDGQNGTGSVAVTFGEELGSNYASIGFTSGVMVGMAGVDTIQVRIHQRGYQMLDQSNDFSFIATGNVTPNRNITPYLNGVQVGGCVPIP